MTWIFQLQVAGEVYAVDEETLLIKNFIYDGNGPDTYFWAGSSNRAGPQGFIVPDETGRTNVLKAYLNKEFTIKLHNGKKISDIKWFSIYDLTLQVFPLCLWVSSLFNLLSSFSVKEIFGDVSIPEGFKLPSEQKLNQLSKRSNGVSSSVVVIKDSKTIFLPNFSYDGLGNGTTLSQFIFALKFCFGFSLISYCHILFIELILSWFNLIKLI